MNDNPLSLNADTDCVILLVWKAMCCMPGHPLPSINDCTWLGPVENMYTCAYTCSINRISVVFNSVNMYIQEGSETICL